MKIIRLTAIIACYLAVVAGLSILLHKNFGNDPAISTCRADLSRRFEGISWVGNDRIIKPLPGSISVLVLGDYDELDLSTGEQTRRAYTCTVGLDGTITEIHP